MIAVAVSLAFGCNRGGAPNGGALPVDSGNDVTPPVDAPPSKVDPPKTSTPRAEEGWTLSRDDNGLFRVRNRRTDVIRSSLTFFERDFKWAQVVTKSIETTDEKSETSLLIPQLGIEGSTRLVMSEADGVAKATLHFKLDVSKALSGISPGGVELQATLNEAVWGGSIPEQKFSADNRKLEVRTKTGTLTFELQGGKGAIIRGPGAGSVRVIVLAGDVAPGTLESSLVVTLPEGGKLAEAPADRHEKLGSKWRADTIAHDAWPVDLSFLQDKPAGNHGHLRVDGESLEFADGTPARFFGTSITAYALFEPDKEIIRQQARRLSAFGFNLVRLHHHDSGWVTPNVFDASGRKLRKQSLESLDWWIKCLNDEGIYVWLDIHVGRVFSTSDGIPGFDELRKGDGHGVSFVNPRVTALMDEFAEDYLDRPNTFTGKTIATDPGIAVLLFTNENDITSHFGASMGPGKGRPVHEAMQREKLEAFAKKAGLSKDSVGKPWEPGAAKMGLADIEHAWFSERLGKLRKMGVRVPVVPTSFWGDDSMYSLPSLLVGDVVDVHAYGMPEALSANPHYEANYLAIMGNAAHVGKPHLTSEYNIPLPSRDRYVAPVYSAAYSAFQGWDAPMLYAYAQTSRARPQGDRWSAWRDQALMAAVPAAALMYRRQDVAQSRKRVVIAPPAEQVYGQQRNVLNSVALRTGLEQTQVVLAMPDSKELSWDRPPDLAKERAKGATIVTDLDQDLLAPEADKIVSDTGELVRDFVEGRFIVSTPRSQVASGWIGGARIELRDGWLELDNPGATFALSSLDGEPIATSKRILVTAIGGAQPEAPMGGEFLSAPMRGRFAVKSSQTLEILPLAAGSAATRTNLEARKGTAGKREGDVQIFDLAGTHTHWWILRAR